MLVFDDKFLVVKFDVDGVCEHELTVDEALASSHYVQRTTPLHFTPQANSTGLSAIGARARSTRDATATTRLWVCALA